MGGSCDVASIIPSSEVNTLSVSEFNMEHKQGGGHKVQVRADVYYAYYNVTTLREGRVFNHE